MGIRSASIQEYAALLAWTAHDSGPTRRRRRVRRATTPATTDRSRVRGPGSPRRGSAGDQLPSGASVQVMEALVRIVNLGSIRLW